VKAGQTTSILRVIRRVTTADLPAICATAALVVIIGISLIWPLLSPYTGAEQDLTNQLSSPDAAHPFGTDLKGRDLFTRVAAGIRVSIAVGLLATGVSVVIGVGYGLLAGYAGGRRDFAMMVWSKPVVKRRQFIILLQTKTSLF